MKIREASGKTKMNRANKIALGFSSLMVTALTFGVVAGSTASADSWNWQRNDNNRWHWQKKDNDRKNWQRHDNDRKHRNFRCDVVIRDWDSRKSWSRDDWNRNDWDFRNRDKVICVIRYDGSRHDFNRWGDQWDDHWDSNWHKNRHEY